MAKKQKQMKADSLPLVAIDLGSDSVRAMAAERVGDDLFRVLGVEQSQRYKCIEQGVITSTTNAGYMINEVLRLLANRIHIENLPTAFVTLGGKSMQIAPVKARRDQLRKREVSADLLESMKQECKDKIESKYTDVAVLELVPSYFVLDGQEQEEAPTGNQRATLVEAHYFAFVGKKELDTRLHTAFDQAGRSIECSFVRPDVLLSVFQCEEAKENEPYDILADGCAVLDMGAQTTTLTVFKGGQYLANKVIPRGGYHITRALEQQGLSFSTAEKLKTLYGYAAPELVEKNYNFRVQTIDGDGEVKVLCTEVAEVIMQKMDEILVPVLEELDKYKDRIERLYITGGASMLHGIDMYLKERTGYDVRYGMHDLLLTHNTDEQYFAPTYSALVGTILMGQDYRDKHKDSLVKKPGFTERIGKTLVDLFTDQQY